MNDNQHIKQPLEIDRSSPKLAFALTGVVLAGIFGGMYYMKNYAQEQAPAWQPQAVPVTAMQVETTELPITLSAIGTLSASEQVLLAAEASGRVASIHFKSGESVAKGEPLVDLYDGTEQAALEAAKANAKLAKSQLDRSERLAKTGVEPLDTLQVRRSTYEQAQAEVTRIEALLRQKQILAPFSGDLGIRQIDLGEYLSPGQPVVSLTALETLFVEFSVPQQAFASIRTGAQVTLTTDAYPNRAFLAEVNAIEPQVDADTRNVHIQATLDNADRALRPGMYVNASLSLDNRKDAILVPNTAIQTSAQGYSAIAIRGENATEKGNAEIIGVQIGERIGNQMVVTSGLNAGDVIVTVGQNRIQPGAEVIVSELSTSDNTGSEER
ncbi:Multidrug resistance protein MdtA precursor [Marinomonas aquimarina]|uniref:Multidrug resistance protein MdtA n=1 Tax=Marinomonas aquimarina TaxID=295068 RepID=A0A1A8T814_9GAMM|nr:efflux RND transporter periplasmic adaptor subunit [Marinomonas aquimarina]SBS27602.1 Multidrug resistance protein MdtA precursor [Marinomonas aquimarina]